MRNDIEIFHLFLGKQQGVYNDIQDYIVDTRKSTLKEVLKKVGQYRLIYFFIIIIYIGFRNTGIKLTLFQSKIICGTIITFFSVTTVYSTYISSTYAYKKFIRPEKERVEKIYTPREHPVSDKNNKISVQGAFPVIKYRFGIQPFESNNKEYSARITNNIIGGLRSIYGINSTTDLRKVRRKNVNLIVVGSFRNIGTHYIITVKVIRVENFKIIYVLSKNIKSVKDIDTACSNIAKMIADNFKYKEDKL